MTLRPLRLPPGVVRAGLRASRPLFASRVVSLPVKRRLVNVLTSAGRAPRATRFERITLAGVRCERAVPPGATADSVLLYFHGGGYALGSARAYRGFAAQLAAQVGVPAIVPDYRLAPEHPHPAALQDALDVYHAVLDEHVDARHVIVAGDSAGGGLGLALVMALRDRGSPLPAAVGLICPWLDLDADVARTRTAASDPLILPRMTTEWAVPYVGEHAATEPAISPVFGDLSRLPPIVVHSAGDDPLAVDADALQAALAGVARGGGIEHVRFAGWWHVFHLQTGVLAAADAAVAALGAALRRHNGARAGAPRVEPVAANETRR
jgi:monoterpene epsilon-lactone hydrolase